MSSFGKRARDKNTINFAAFFFFLLVDSRGGVRLQRGGGRGKKTCAQHNNGAGLSQEVLA